jgi:hypothetical protein
LKRRRQEWSEKIMASKYNKRAEKKKKKKKNKKKKENKTNGGIVFVHLSSYSA